MPGKQERVGARRITLMHLPNQEWNLNDCFTVRQTVKLRTFFKHKFVLECDVAQLLRKACLSGCRGKETRDSLPTSLQHPNNKFVRVHFGLLALQDAGFNLWEIGGRVQSGSSSSACAH